MTNLAVRESSPRTTITPPPAFAAARRTPAGENPAGLMPAAAAIPDAARATAPVPPAMPPATICAIRAPARSGLPEPDSGPSLAGEKGRKLRTVDASSDALDASAPNIDWMPEMRPCTMLRPALYSSRPVFPRALRTLPGMPRTTPIRRDTPDEAADLIAFHPLRKIDLAFSTPDENAFLIAVQARDTAFLIHSHAAEAAFFSASQNCDQATLIRVTASRKVAFTSSKSPKMIALMMSSAVVTIVLMKLNPLEMTPQIRDTTVLIFCQICSKTVWTFCHSDSSVGLACSRISLNFRNSATTTISGVNSSPSTVTSPLVVPMTFDTHAKIFARI